MIKSVNTKSTIMGNGRMKIVKKILVNIIRGNKAAFCLLPRTT